LQLLARDTFERVGNLPGARLMVTSSGARAPSDVVGNGARQQPDLHAPATTHRPPRTGHHEATA
jgi:hypothetical protein